jgi:hypothetical protein
MASLLVFFFVPRIYDFGERVTFCLIAIRPCRRRPSPPFVRM